ncbi:MAG: rane protein involved in the export of O-antigen and teichoic acid-like protein [Hyphomicrobiales bacterium]|nr:rane protein involved in the export of O-antigen and teichoic acid-like protein [Hyphomicrobiales bacterium]
MSVLAAFFFNMVFNFVSGLLAAKFLGPDQFGRFALALIIAGVIQMVAFDWLRLSAVRFYSRASRADQPELRATLDFSFRVAALAVTGLGLAIVASRLDLPPSPVLLGLTCAVAIANALFDYHSALARGRFLDRVYLRLTLTKNLIALALVAGAAYVTGSALAALVGMCVSMAGATFFARRGLADPGSPLSLAARDLAIQCARYSGPIVAANLLYMLVPLVNRAIIAGLWGYAETGLFSLAYDVGVRLVGALALALDILLFQVAVRADAKWGRAAAQEQVARNAATVFAVLLPCTVGLWLTLPSVERLIVPDEFHGAFSEYLSVLLPGMFCYAMSNCAVNATFQIDRKTWPLILAALVGCLANVALFVVLKGTGSPHAVASAQSWAFVAAFAALLVFAVRSGARMPRWRDLLATCAGVGAMYVVVLPMRAWEPGLATALAQASAGAATFGAFVLALDIAGMRSGALAALRKRR